MGTQRVIDQRLEGKQLRYAVFHIGMTCILHVITSSVNSSSRVRRRCLAIDHRAVKGLLEAHCYARARRRILLLVTGSGTSLFDSGSVEAVLENIASRTDARVERQ